MVISASRKLPFADRHYLLIEQMRGVDAADGVASGEHEDCVRLDAVAEELDAGEQALSLIPLDQIVTAD